MLPVSYPKFHSMVERGDTIFLGRYLVTGSEESSLFLHVRWLGVEGAVLHVRVELELLLW